MGTFYGLKMYIDKFKKYPQRFKIGKARVWKIYILYVLKLKLISMQDFAETFPEQHTLI
jgi:hypothetical protein